jgi:hypothetical protein
VKIPVTPPPIMSAATMRPTTAHDGRERPAPDGADAATGLTWRGFGLRPLVVVGCVAVGAAAVVAAVVVSRVVVAAGLGFGFFGFVYAGGGGGGGGGGGPGAVSMSVVVS